MQLININFRFLALSCPDVYWAVLVMRRLLKNGDRLDGHY